MSQTILQINYKLVGPRAEYEKENLPYAAPIADSPGLIWKVWIINEEKAEAGGIYLFDSKDSAQAFVDGPIGAELQADPTLSLKSFDVIEELSAVTRGPLGRGSLNYVAVPRARSAS